MHPFVTTVNGFQLLLKTAPSYVRQEFCVCFCASISLLCNIYGWFQSRNIVMYACLFYLWAKCLKTLEKHLWWSQVLIKFQGYNHDTLMAKKYQVCKSLQQHYLLEKDRLSKNPVTSRLNNWAIKIINPLSANPTKCSYELFECVWPFCEIGA